MIEFEGSIYFEQKISFVLLHFGVMWGTMCVSHRSETDRRGPTWEILIRKFDEKVTENFNYAPEEFRILFTSGCGTFSELKAYHILSHRHSSYFRKLSKRVNGATGKIGIQLTVVFSKTAGMPISMQSEIHRVVTLWYECQNRTRQCCSLSMREPHEKVKEHRDGAEKRPIELHPLTTHNTETCSP